MSTTTALPRIIAIIGRTDAGEYGATACPHCGALGRYVTTFACADGTTRGAMSGCIKLFPISKLAEEHKRIIERKAERDRKGQTLASWDTAKLAAIDAVMAGTMSEDQALTVVRDQNYRRSEWMDRNKRGRR